MADAVVLGVRDEEVSRGVDDDPGWGPQLGARGGATVAVEAGAAGAGDGGDDPGAGCDLADAEVALVSNEEVARGIDGDIVREVQRGAGGQAAVAAEAGNAAAGDGGDDPGAGRDLTDAVVLGVRDEQIALGVDDDPCQGPHLSPDRRASLAPQAGAAGAGDGGDDPGAGRDLADA